MNEVAEKIKKASFKAPEISDNPYPGLRPFSIEESHLFFGREGQSEEVLQKLSDNRFVAVVGASGTGKSSLIYCGLIPVLYGGFIASAGSQWRVIVTRPGSSPIENLASAITRNTNEFDNQEDFNLQKQFYEAILRQNSFGLKEALGHLSANSNENILLLVDQFEELFRFRLNKKTANDSADPGIFVKLLVEAVKQTELPIYVVITMRSDFIGECSHFQELTTLINMSNYLIPQMTRNDFREAILGPVAVGGAEMEPALLHQLLNDVGDNPDQLPILQHAMMRTWDYWLHNSERNKPVGIPEYEAIGKMEKALSEHANEAFDELNDEGKWICEVLFKTITEKGADNRGVRRPTRLEDIALIADVTIEKVITVIDTFRMPGRSFITPAYGNELNANSVIDLSHESLMRIWNRLRTWVDEESNAVQMYLRLSEAAALYQEGKTSLWRPPDLLIARNWEKKQKPTLAWAQRHNPAFERTMVFLHTSEKDYEAEEQNKIRLQKRTLKRTRMFAVILGTASIISLGFMLYAQVQKQEATKQTILAKKNADEALQQKKIALSQTEEALRQKEFATTQSKIAEQQKILAEKNSNEAQKQQQIATNKSIEATQQKTLAEKNAQEATQQKIAAEKAQLEAFNRRMITIAQSMAVKSLQIYEDNDLKSLLAYQAYIYNNQYNGPKHNADIYAGLYSALMAKKGKSYNILKGHTDALNSMVFSPTGNILFTAGSDGKVFKWNMNESPKSFTTILSNNSVNKTIAISPDGTKLVCGTLGIGIQLINISDTAVIARLTTGCLTVTSVKFTADGKKILAACDNNLIEWDFNKNISTIVANNETTILAISVSSDNNSIAGGTKNGKIIIWDKSNNYSPSILFTDSKNQFHSVTFNHSGDELASGDLMGYLRVWDVKTKKQIISMRGHSARIAEISYSPNDKLLATSGYDANVLLWDATNFITPPYKLRNHESWVLSLAFSSKGDMLVSGSLKEERLIIWPVNTNETATIVQKEIGRNFTQDEWNTYVGSDIPIVKVIN